MLLIPLFLGFAQSGDANQLSANSLVTRMLRVYAGVAASKESDPTLTADLLIVASESNTQKLIDAATEFEVRRSKPPFADLPTIEQSFDGVIVALCFETGAKFPFPLEEVGGELRVTTRQGASGRFSSLSSNLKWEAAHFKRRDMTPFLRAWVIQCLKKGLAD